MQKVYIIIFDHDDDYSSSPSDILGIYTTKESAIERAKTFVTRNTDEIYVYEIICNTPINLDDCTRVWENPDHCHVKYY